MRSDNVTKGAQQAPHRSYLMHLDIQEKKWTDR